MEISAHITKKIINDYQNYENFKAFISNRTHRGTILLFFEKKIVQQKQ